MYAYESNAPSLVFDIERRKMLKIKPVETADAYMTDIETNIKATTKMLNKFVDELKISISTERKLRVERERLAKDIPAKENPSDTASRLSKEIEKLNNRLEIERRQTENCTKVMTSINGSHDLISMAVTNMSTTIGKLFEKNSKTFKRLVKIGKDTADIYQRIITTLALIETVFLKRFGRHAAQNRTNLDTMMEAVAAYYQLNTIIINKYAWNVQDVKDTMTVGRLDIAAYYDKQMSEHMATKDSFLDFATSFAKQRSSNFQRFIDTTRPWKTTDSIGISILGFLSGLGFGYHKNRKWR